MWSNWCIMFGMATKKAAQAMTAETQKLCGRCQERPATCFISYGQAGETKSLCETCYNESVSPAEAGVLKRMEELIRSGSCSYCGAPAKAGLCSSFGLSLQFPNSQINFGVEQCQQDLKEFGLRPENALPEVLPFDDPAAQKQLFQQLDERQRRQEAFMQQKVLERTSRNDAQ